MSFLENIQKDFSQWLAKPFPFPGKWYQKIIPSFSVSVMIYLILLIFRPFGVANIVSGANWFISGYSFITLYVMLTSVVIGPILLNRFFNPETWTIGKYLVHIAFDYLVATFFSWVYTMNAGKGITETFSFIMFCWFTFSVSLFPVLMIVFYYERILFRRKLIRAAFYTDRLVEFRQLEGMPTTLKLVMAKKSGENCISSGDFICALANGNYSMVHYYRSGEIRHDMVRIPITLLEKLCHEDLSIVRCHRSALVNLRYASKFTGNARNYFIHVDCVQLKLNISRTIPAPVLEKLRKL